MSAPRLAHRPALLLGTALLALSACSQPFDLDLRNFGGNALDTSDAPFIQSERPEPDSRGLITYSSYQVVVTRPDDTISAIAQRLGIDAQSLADYNGIAPNVPLRAGEIIALNQQVSVEGTATPGPSATGGAPRVDVTTLAEDAINRAAPAATDAQPNAPVTTPQASGPEPIRHRVRRGETAFGIARRYNIPVRVLAEWNGLDSDLSIRENQTLLIPEATGRAAPPSEELTVTTPGAGTVAPEPPSAAEPLPEDEDSVAVELTPPAAPVLDIPEETEEEAADAPFIYPVNGSIIRDYAKGRNEGIDIGAPAGTDVKAAANGVVAAVTRDTNGVAILVLRHADGLLTVYTNLDNIEVSKDDRVSQGSTLGTVRDSSPSFVHFEIRRGLESLDPKNYLP